mmetsp:Transcript_27700/g.41042  ORF Transcript_27700/g.41042 Transcript_27700/m.41042 type:complete len:435 (+) Transcript_27700:234-1538(+)
MTVSKIKHILLRLTAIVALSCSLNTQVEAADGSTSSMHTQYNELASTEWPGTGEWLDLSRSLSVFAELYGPFKPSDYKDQCTEDGKVDPTNPVEVASAGEGICMQYPTCSNKYCLGQQSASPSASALAARSNLPAYVLEAKAEEDIVKGMQFANKYKIQVTVKSSGHSLMGASTAKDSLLIWLAKYPVDNTIQTMYQDSCKDPDEGPDVIIHDAVIGVAAGQNFKSIAEAVGDAYHFVSASEWTVSASGGFFQGGGLSYTSRKYGLGVDNVVDLRVVLPSSAVVIADRCTKIRTCIHICNLLDSNQLFTELPKSFPLGIILCLLTRLKYLTIRKIFPTPPLQRIINGAKYIGICSSLRRLLQSDHHNAKDHIGIFEIPWHIPHHIRPNQSWMYHVHRHGKLGTGTGTGTLICLIIILHAFQFPLCKLIPHENIR